MAKGNLTDPISVLDLDTRLINGLAFLLDIDRPAAYTSREWLISPDCPTIADLTAHSFAEVMRVPNLGVKSYRKLRDQIVEYVGVENLPTTWHPPGKGGWPPSSTSTLAKVRRCCSELTALIRRVDRMIAAMEREES